MFYPWGYGEKPSDHDRATELGWGRMLTPRGLEGASPDCGGMYAAKSPPMNPDDKGKVRYGYAGKQLRA